MKKICGWGFRNFKTSLWILGEHVGALFFQFSNCMRAPVSASQQKHILNGAFFGSTGAPKRRAEVAGFLEGRKPAPVVAAKASPKILAHGGALLWGAFRGKFLTTGLSACRLLEPKLLLPCFFPKDNAFLGSLKPNGSVFRKALLFWTHIQNYFELDCSSSSHL